MAKAYEQRIDRAQEEAQTVRMAPRSMLCARAVPKLQPGDLQPGMRAMTLISKWKPASQLTPTAVQFG